MRGSIPLTLQKSTLLLTSCLFRDLLEIGSKIYTNMKVSMMKNELLAAVKGCNPQTNSVLPILDNIRISANAEKAICTIDSNTLETYISNVLDAQVIEEGECLIDGQKLLKILSLADGLITIESDGKKTIIKTGQGTFSFAQVDNLDEWPAMAEIGQSNTVSIPLAELQKIISRSIFACSKDDTRPALCGILVDFNNGWIVATDAHKLPFCPTIKQEDFRAFIMPLEAAKAILAMSDSGNAKIMFDGRIVGLKTRNTHITFSAIDANFPQWQAVLPKKENVQMICERAALITAINQALLTASKTTKGMKMSFGADILRISTRDEDYDMESIIEISCTHDNSQEFDIGFNAGFLLECLKHLEGNEVTFSFGDPAKACIMQGNGPEKVLLMPIVLAE